MQNLFSQVRILAPPPTIKSSVQPRRRLNTEEEQGTTAVSDGRLSWPNVLIRQTTSLSEPFDIGVAVATGDSRLLRGTPCRQAVRLADTWQRGNCGQPGAYPGFTPVLSCFNQPTSMFFSNNREGPLRILERSLSNTHIMENGDMCAQGTSNARHVATLAGLKTCRDDYGTSGTNHKTASDHISPAFI